MVRVGLFRMFISTNLVYFCHLHVYIQLLENLKKKNVQYKAFFNRKVLVADEITIHVDI